MELLTARWGGGSDNIDDWSSEDWESWQTPERGYSSLFYRAGSFDQGLEDEGLDDDSFEGDWGDLEE